MTNEGTFYTSKTARDNARKDLTGKVITKGDTVIVPEPDETDIHHNGFVGQVESFRGDNVVDGEGDCFEIEPERLEIQDED